MVLHTLRSAQPGRYPGSLMSGLAVGFSPPIWQVGAHRAAPKPAAPATASPHLTY